MRLRVSCCRNVRPKRPTVRDFLGEGLRQIFVSNLLSSASLPWRNLSLIIWSRLLSRLKFLTLLLERNRGIQQRASIIKYIRNTLCPHLRGMILKSDLAARKRGLCEMLHQLQLVTHGTLNRAMVIGDVAVFPERGTASRVLNSSNGATHLSRRERRVPMLSYRKLTSLSRSTSLLMTRGETIPTHAQRCP